MTQCMPPAPLLHGRNHRKVFYVLRPWLFWVSLLIHHPASAGFFTPITQGVNVDDYGNELPAMTGQQINRRFGEGSERMAGIERALAAERRELQELKGQLSDLLEFFNAMRGAFKVLNWVGKVAKPVAAIVSLGAAMGAAYAAWRGVQ